jgi:hypothetical protein
MLSGRVIHVYSWKKIKLQLPRSDRQVDVHLNEPMPFGYGDIVIGEISESIPIYFTNVISATIGTDPDTISKFISTFLTRSDTKKLDEHLTRENLSLDEIANNWNMYRTTGGLTQIIHESSVKTILRNTVEKRLRRSLLLQGITREDTYTFDSEFHCGRDLLGIDRLLRRNAYVAKNISYEKAKKITCFNLVTPLPVDQQLGYFVRFLYEHQKNGFAWFPDTEFVQLPVDVQNRLKSEFGIVHRKSFITFKANYDCESDIAKWIRERLAEPERAFRLQVSPEGEILSTEQRAAVRMALGCSFSIITGPAGSGKTTIIKEIIHQLNRRGIRFVVASFTGRAVQRVREVCQDVPAYTIDRLLASVTRPPFDHLLIDEISMVTSELFRSVLQTFRHDYAVTLIGDDNQLEPIGHGRFFRQLLSIPRIPTSRLTVNYRSQSDVLINALSLLDHKRLLIEGQHPPDFTLVDNDKFRVWPHNDIQFLDFLLTNMLEKNTIDQLLVVTPFVYAVKQINSMIQEKLATKREGPRVEYANDNGKWIVGDRVMMMKNNYEINVMHSEIGLITEITKDYIVVDFDFAATQKSNVNRIGYFYKKYTGKDEDMTLKLVSLAYCFTSHTCQGAEAEHVILYVPPSKRDFITNNMLYTMLTRAKGDIFVIAEPWVISKSAKTLTPYQNDQLFDIIKEE